MKFFFTLWGFIPLLSGCFDARSGSSLALARLYLPQGNDAGVIPPQQFDEFIDAVVMPSYPHGVTLTPANGGWAKPDGASIRGRIVILEVVFEDDDVGRESVVALLAHYRERFRQPAAMLVIERSLINHP